MHPRAQAIRILEQARDLLADRLVQRVLDSRDEINEDAEGNTYVSEIEQIFDHIGARLNHVNALLANMPSPPPEEPAEEESVFTPESLQLALPSPEPTKQFAPAAMQLPPPATMQHFVVQIADTNLDTAARTLAELFDVDLERARNWTNTFAQRCDTAADLPAKAVLMHQDALAGRLNAALALVWECFGLQGMEALAVLQALRARLSGETQSPING